MRMPEQLRRPHRPARIRAAVVFMLVPLAVLGVAGIAQPASSNVLVAAAPPAAAGPLNWAPCFDQPLPGLPQGHERMECAAMTVPLDWRHPRNGRTIEIAVSRLRPITGRPQGTLFLNPGGPGVPGLLMPMQLLQRPKIAATFELVGFDVRGTGESALLSCGSQTTSGNDARDRSPANLRLIADTDDLYARYCAASGRDLMPLVNTEQTVRDLDHLRASLGWEKINWLGYSGGSWLGAYYATYFPDRVGRFVLDSNTEFTGSWQDVFGWQPLGFERRFGTDFAPWAARHDNILHLGDTAAEVRQFLERLRADLARTLVEVPALGPEFDLPHLLPTVTVRPTELDTQVINAMYSKENFAPLAESLLDLRRRADAGNAGPTSLVASRPLSVDAARLVVRSARTAAGGARPVGLDASASTFSAITCNDTPWTRDRGFWQRRSEQLGRQYPLAGWSTLVNPCATWQRPPLNLPTPTGRGVPPVLMVQSVRDPATPLEGALRAHRNFAGSRLLTVADEGDHAIYNAGNACVDDLVDTFLIDGRMPTQETCQGLPIPDPATSAARKSGTPDNPLLRLAAHGDIARGRLRIPRS